MLIRRSSNHYK